jgi:hypothetical protein
MRGHALHQLDVAHGAGENRRLGSEAFLLGLGDPRLLQVLNLFKVSGKILKKPVFGPINWII